MNKGYTLEVVSFNKKTRDMKHVGYMDINFKTKEEVCEYYDNHNPHMRKLNAHNTHKSDWDPKTCLLYIARKDYYLISSISHF